MSDIELLNRAVDRLHPQLPAKTWLWAGKPVYVERYTFLVYMFALFAIGCILSAELEVWDTLSLGFAACLCYDWYSGILHIVLDTLEFVGFPLLGQACLEFQMHHKIPDDICRKSFANVCGDANSIVIISILCNLYTLSNPVTRVLVGWKILFAYFGQWSHRCSHLYKKEQRTLWVQYLQNFGAMISVKKHRIHHSNNHDRNFCLIGWFNPVLNWLFERVSNGYVWLFVWSMLTCYDLKFITWCLS